MARVWFSFSILTLLLSYWPIRCHHLLPCGNMGFFESYWNLYILHDLGVYMVNTWACSKRKYSLGNVWARMVSPQKWINFGAFLLSVFHVTASLANDVVFFPKKYIFIPKTDFQWFSSPAPCKIFLQKLISSNVSGQFENFQEHTTVEQWNSMLKDFINSGF